MYGFEGECRAKYTERVFKVFSESFSALPLATLIGKKHFVLHGGLFSNDDITLDDVRKLNRHKQRQPGQSGLMMEMLWTDPQPLPGRGPSKRGVGLQFGPDVTRRFCERNGLHTVIRSHEVRMNGYEVEHDGMCITGQYSHYSSSFNKANFAPQSSRHPGTATARKTRARSSTLVPNSSSNSASLRRCRILTLSQWRTLETLSCR